MYIFTIHITVGVYSPIFFLNVADLEIRGKWRFIADGIWLEIIDKWWNFLYAMFGYH